MQDLHNKPSLESSGFMRNRTVVDKAVSNGDIESLDNIRFIRGHDR